MLSPPSSPPPLVPPTLSYLDAESPMFFESEYDPASSPPEYDDDNVRDLPEMEMTDEPPTIDMLIRAASTFLSIFNEPTDGFPSSPSSAVRVLSRVAILFNEEASSMTTVLLEKQAILLRMIQVRKYSPSTESTYLKSKIGPDWLQSCCL